MNLRARYCLAITLLPLAGVVLAGMEAPYSAKVVGVSDGDTQTVLRNREQVKIRLNGVDATETG